MGKLRYIDALRGWAVLGVLLVHCSKAGTSNFPFLIGNIFDHGAMGVQLFYVVSAFTLFLSHQRRADKEQHPTLNFFIRRFFRIAPLFYLAVAYYLFQDGLGPRYWLGDMDRITTGNIVSNFFFVHGFNPYWINSIVPGGWSISVEMIFYCMVPFLVVKIKSLNNAISFLTVSLLLKTAFDFIWTSFPQISDGVLWNNFLYFYIPAQLPVFALGFILFFLVIRNPDVHESLSPSRILAAAAALILQFGIGFNSNHIAFAIVYVALAWALSAYTSSWAINRLTVYLGKISFSLYLVHFAVLHWMEHFSLLEFVGGTSIKASLINMALRLVVLLVGSSCLATLSFYVVEQPFQMLGKHVIRLFEQSKLPMQHES